MRTILVKPSIAVPAVYLDLEDSEVVCPKCKGIGSVRTVFGPRWIEQRTVTCSECNGKCKGTQNMREVK